MCHFCNITQNKIYTNSITAGSYFMTTYLLFTMPIVLIKHLPIALWLYLLSRTTIAMQSTTQLCAQRNNIRSKVNEGDSQDYEEDLVRKQYLSFPYPYVSTEHIQMEQDYYQTHKRNIPIVTYPSLDLDMVNHYLYQGGNSFK